MAGQNGRARNSRRGTGGARSASGTKSRAAVTKQAKRVLAAEQRAGKSVGEQEQPFHRPRFHRAFSFGLITLAFFLISWVGQFFFQMTVVTNEAEEHGGQFTWGDFIPQFLASSLENWQSEFLQLLWQAAGLALFYFWGSSQSKESDERIEAKLDMLLRERGIGATKL